MSQQISRLRLSVKEKITRVSANIQDGWSPLMFASLNGHVDVVETLLQYGATLDKPDRVSTMDEFLNIVMQLGYLDTKLPATKLEMQDNSC